MICRESIQKYQLLSTPRSNITLLRSVLPPERVRGFIVFRVGLGFHNTAHTSVVTHQNFTNQFSRKNRRGLQEKRNGETFFHKKLNWDKKELNKKMFHATAPHKKQGQRPCFCLTRVQHFLFCVITVLFAHTIATIRAVVATARVTFVLAHFGAVIRHVACRARGFHGAVAHHAVMIHTVVHHAIMIHTVVHAAHLFAHLGAVFFRRQEAFFFVCSGLLAVMIWRRHRKRGEGKKTKNDKCFDFHKKLLLNFVIKLRAKARGCDVFLCCGFCARRLQKPAIGGRRSTSKTIVILGKTGPLKFALAGGMLNISGP